MKWPLSLLRRVEGKELVVSMLIHHTGPESFASKMSTVVNDYLNTTWSTIPGIYQIELPIASRKVYASGLFPESMAYDSCLWTPSPPWPSDDGYVRPGDQSWRARLLPESVHELVFDYFHTRDGNIVAWMALSADAMLEHTGFQSTCNILYPGGRGLLPKGKSLGFLVAEETCEFSFERIFKMYARKDECLQRYFWDEVAMWCDDYELGEPMWSRLKPIMAGYENAIKDAFDCIDVRCDGVWSEEEGLFGC